MTRLTVGDELERLERLERENAALRAMLESATCPDPTCIGGSIRSTGPDPQDDACEWCYGRHMLLTQGALEQVPSAGSGQP